MKTSLPITSEAHELHIKEIAEIIVKTAPDKIAFVILFGAFARGNWIRCKYNDSGTTYDYASNYDFLVITKSGKQANSISSFDFERKIRKEIGKTSKWKHQTHIIIESINRVNDDLKKSQCFFSDIRKEGILLYDCGKFTLSHPKEFRIDQKEKITSEHYKHWSNGANGFLDDYKNALKRNDYQKASFYLHQTAENLYNCTLLTLGGYKPKSHDLNELNQLCTFYSHDFLTIFPKANNEQKECFELLQKSYIDARYSKYFFINKGQLEYLTSRIEKLKGLVETVCG